MGFKEQKLKAVSLVTGAGLLLAAGTGCSNTNEGGDSTGADNGNVYPTMDPQGNIPGLETAPLTAENPGDGQTLTSESYSYSITIPSTWGYSNVENVPNFPVEEIFGNLDRYVDNSDPSTDIIISGIQYLAPADFSNVTELSDDIVGVLAERSGQDPASYIISQGPSIAGSESLLIQSLSEEGYTTEESVLFLSPTGLTLYEARLSAVSTKFEAERENFNRILQSITPY